ARSPSGSRLVARSRRTRSSDRSGPGGRSTAIRQPMAIPDAPPLRRVERTVPAEQPDELTLACRRHDEWSRSQGRTAPARLRHDLAGGEDGIRTHDTPLERITV